MVGAADARLRHEFRAPAGERAHLEGPACPSTATRNGLTSRDGVESLEIAARAPEASLKPDQQFLVGPLREDGESDALKVRQAQHTSGQSRDPSAGQGVDVRGQTPNRKQESGRDAVGEIGGP